MEYIYRNNINKDDILKDTFCWKKYAISKTLINMKYPLKYLEDNNNHYYYNRKRTSICLYCKTNPLGDYCITFACKEFPYPGYNYPHLDFHRNCLIDYVKEIDNLILTNGRERVDKILYKFFLFLSSEVLIPDVNNYIGMILVKI